MQNIAYKGTDYIPFSNPKFLNDARIDLAMPYLELNTDKLFDLTLTLGFTSMGTTASSSWITKSTSALLPLFQQYNVCPLALSDWAT